MAGVPEEHLLIDYEFERLKADVIGTNQQSPHRFPPTIGVSQGQGSGGTVPGTPKVFTRGHSLDAMQQASLGDRKSVV